MGEAKTTGWRNSPNIDIHPAAELFPLLSSEDLDQLAEDIKKNGLQEPVSIIEDGVDHPRGKQIMLDGRNRLDAMELAGFQVLDRQGRLHKKWRGAKFYVGFFQSGQGLYNPSIDPFYKHVEAEAFIVSKNIHRRHLTQDQKRELIEKLLKAKPERSDRATAKLAKVDNKTVATKRKELEAREEIPHVETRVDTKGREQPAKKKSAAKAAEAVEGQRLQGDERSSPAVELNGVGDGVVIQPPAEEEEGFSPAEWSDHEETNQWILSYVDLAKHERRQAHQAFKILAASRFLLFSTAMEGFGAWFRRLTEPEQEQVRKVTAPKVPLKALKAAWEATPPDVRPKFIQWTERREYRRPIPPVIDNQPV